MRKKGRRRKRKETGPEYEAAYRADLAQNLKLLWYLCAIIMLIFLVNILQCFICLEDQTVKIQGCVFLLFKDLIADYMGLLKLMISLGLKTKQTATKIMTLF